MKILLKGKKPKKRALNHLEAQKRYPHLIGKNKRRYSRIEIKKMQDNLIKELWND